MRQGSRRSQAAKPLWCLLLAAMRLCAVVVVKKKARMRG
jgi:hypothetical protein